MKLYLDAKEVRAVLLAYANSIATQTEKFNEVDFDIGQSPNYEYQNMGMAMRAAPELKVYVLHGATISFSEVVAKHGAEDE